LHSHNHSQETWLEAVTGKKKVIRKLNHLFAWVQLLCVKEGYSQWETENWTLFQKKQDFGQ